MQFILDHIAATVVFITVAFAIIVTQLRAQQATIESTIAYMSKKQTLELADMLEKELKMIGEGTSAGQKIDSVATNSSGLTTEFIFWRNDGVADLKIEYRLVEVDSATFNSQKFPIYRMDRYVNGVQEGGSPSTLRDFRIEPLNAGGNVVAPAAARLVRARVVNTYPLGKLEDMQLGQTVWGMTLHPLNLD